VTASVIFWLLSSIRNVRSEARFLYYLVTAINAVRPAAGSKLTPISPLSR
jgi:hypothetical protein